MKWNVTRLALIGFAQLLLMSCSYNPFISNNHTTGSPVGAGVGALTGAGAVAALGGPKPLMAFAGIGGGALGYYVTTLRYDSSGVIDAGGQVYKNGQYVGIYIPTDSLFEVNTAEFTENAEPILDSVVAVLNRYPNNNILISGNTSGFNRPQREQVLSQKRAREVAAYLWKAGINEFRSQSIEPSRKLKYVGYGDYFPIANTYTNKGIRQNSRIQITSYPSRRDILPDRNAIIMRDMGKMGECSNNAC
ncbi:MAG: hypothetical protein A3F14_02310 [Gammaproteobacteria bacterium RIFCSPHIGHO2_12_FULL_43_28]|nr:MAG: hypothetical protein A3F14_02310 [Gammaproteobacteria bacterium RIFCSPHIGHO2_12_FULL_43_28]